MGERRWTPILQTRAAEHERARLSTKEQRRLNESEDRSDIMADGQIFWDNVRMDTAEIAYIEAIARNNATLPTLNTGMLNKADQLERNHAPRTGGRPAGWCNIQAAV